MWHTEIAIPDSEFQFTHADRMLALGSCFADQTGRRLQDLQFDIQINPFGVLYNPFSLSKVLGYISGRVPWLEEQVFYNQRLWRHFDFHSRISHVDQGRFIDKVQNQIADTRVRMKTTSLVLLTFGTAFVWERAGNVVGNCHKLPASEFNRRMLTIKEILRAIRSCIEYIHVMNDDVVIVLTVSPVRHKRDGLIENSWSKARLLDACRTISNDASNLIYFPSYEIMLDELRDYRFYSTDMLHPSDQATDYIFSRFLKTHFNTVPNELLRLIRQVQKSIHHRNMHDHSVDDKQQSKIQNSIKLIKEKYDLNLFKDLQSV